MALEYLNEQITTALDNGLSTIGIFIDVKKAFDRIDYDILYKNRVYWTKRNCIKLDKKQPKCKKTICGIGNVKSSLENIVRGVPQGSILGQLLFVIYMNDISNVSNILKFVLFVDDTTIFTTTKKHG